MDARDAANVTVSICIPAYRQPGSLRRCLESIAAQTYRRFEVIVSDDSPDDAVEAVTHEFSGAFELTYARNRPAKGTPENWNEAMRGARGRLIMVLHHDDWLYDGGALGELVASLDTAGAELAFGRSLNVASDGSVVSAFEPDARRLRRVQRDIRILFHHNWIGAPSAVLLRNKGVRFDPRLRWLVDVEFYMRQVGAGKVAYNPRAVVGIGVGPLQATSSCYGNADVEIGENLTVYAGLRRRPRDVIPDLLHFYRLLVRLRPAPAIVARFRPPAIFRIAFALSRAWVAVRGITRRIRGIPVE